MKLFICLLLGISITNTNGLIESTIKPLTENFFANLQANLGDTDLNAEAIKFIDDQINNYVNLIEESRNGVEDTKNTRNKRESAGNNNYETFIVNGLIPINTIPIEHPKDIMLFKHTFNDNEKWYSAAIEHDFLVIFKYLNNTFVEIQRKIIKNGLKLGIHTMINKTCIVVAENTESNVNFKNKTGIFEFDALENLNKIQNLDVDYASDVAIWEEKGTVFMAITKEKSIIDGVIDYEVDSIIYKWLGKHFDIVQRIKTSNAAKITPFVIGGSHFLAIANKQNNLGETNIYSEIYKYDLHLDKFVLHQKILTEAASDIQFFCFKNLNEKDNFLVVANMYMQDKHGSIAYSTNSIIYKYVDKYFIPFQSFKLIGAQEWLPVVGPLGEFALFVISKYEGLKIFQYDGWRFVESETQYSEETFGNGLKSMNSYIFNNKPVVVVANEKNNGKMPNLYEIIFQDKNMLNQFYDDMLVWCKKELQGTDIQSQKYEEISNKVARQAPIFDPELLPFSEMMPNEDRKTDGNNFDTNTIELQLKQIESQLNDQHFELTQIKAMIQAIQSSSEVNIIHGDVFAENVIFTNDNFFNEFTSETINDIITVDFLRNIIHLNSPLQINKLNLQKARIDEINPRLINGHTIDALIYKTTKLQLDSLIINGTAYFEDGLTINKTLNGINFNKKNVLLIKGNQNFQGDLNVTEIDTQKVEAKFLNKLGLASINTKAVKTIKIANIDTLKAKNVIVGGFMNHIDLPTLDKYALRKFGNQEITNEYFFDSLITNNIEINNYLNHKKIPEELIRIDEGEYIIQQEVKFIEDVIADKLVVLERLNQVSVIDGQLDVLLNNSSKIQSITGYKIFENITLTDTLKLQGKFDNEAVDKMNPVTVIEDEIVLIGNYVMQGDVAVEQFLGATDYVTYNNEHSIRKLVDIGVKISDKEVPVHLDFTQQLNVLDIYVDTINNIDPHAWVVNGGTERQYIKGGKTFIGDLTITDRTNLQNVNTINIPDLEQNVLKIDGNQIITGKHYIQHLSTDSLNSENIKLGTNDFTNLLTQNTEQHLSGLTIIQSLTTKNLITENIQTNGTINNLNFNHIIADTVFKQNTQKIKGQKHFKNITIQELISRKSINMQKIPLLIKKAEAVFNNGRPTELPDNLEIENIYFGNYINGLSAAEFGGNWLDSNANAAIVDDQFFDTITIYGNAFIASNHLNDLNLNDVANNTLKTDEDHHFESAVFKKELVSMDIINLEGHVEGLDIDNILTDSGKAILASNKIFNDIFFVEEAFFAEDLINNFNLSQLCKFFNNDDLNIIINGSVNFMNGPQISQINGQELAFFDDAWISNNITTLLGNLNFDEVYFEEDLTVKGFVDETDLQWLLNNYFSKSKNQTISAKLDFTQGINFGSDVYAPEVKLSGAVYGINLEDFVTTAILDGVDQVFEDIFFADACEIIDLQGEFLVNQQNLQSDVMLYNSDNIVTGKKIIKDVVTDLLEVHRHYKVQNVDLLAWIHSGVLKSGNQHIAGRIMFNKATVFNNGIGLEGVLNGIKFNENNIMLKSTSQIIEGNKIFYTNPTDPSVFKSIKLKGYLNNIDIAEFIKNQAFKNEDTTFQSQINLNSDLSAQNVNFEGLYLGVNISNLINNLTNYVALNNYFNNYVKLYDVSKKVKESLDNQAYYLSFYRPVQIFHGVRDVFPIKLSSGLHLGVVHYVNNTEVIDFLKLDHGIFSTDTELPEVVAPNGYFTYVKSIECDSSSYLYVEHAFTDGTGLTHLGNILDIKENSTSYVIVNQQASNGTRKIVSFALPETDRSCILILYTSEVFMNIYCEKENQLELHERLNIEYAIDANIITIDNCIYITAINMAIPPKESSVMIWKYDNHTELFNLHQHIYEFTPNCISTVSHNGVHYLAIGSGYMYNTIYSGQIDIRRFDVTTGHFTQWQQITITAPIQVELSVLPSNELILYILCDNPAEPLVTYKYEGISKFSYRMIESTLNKYHSMQLFSDENNHFVIIQADNHFTLIQAVFKGRN